MITEKQFLEAIEIIKEYNIQVKEITYNVLEEDTKELYLLSFLESNLSKRTINVLKLGEHSCFQLKGKKLKIYTPFQPKPEKLKRNEIRIKDVKVKDVLNVDMHVFKNYRNAGKVTVLELCNLLEKHNINSTIITP